MVENRTDGYGLSDAVCTMCSDPLEKKRKDRMTAVADETSDRPFGRTLHDLLTDREEFLTGTGNVNWRAVAESMHGVHYESLRKAVAGERLPPATLIEQAADLAGVDPSYFVEYELAQVQRQFDVREVGFDQAVDNLRTWAEAQKKRRR